MPEPIEAARTRSDHTASKKQKTDKEIENYWRTTLSTAIGREYLAKMTAGMLRAEFADHPIPDNLKEMVQNQIVYMRETKDYSVPTLNSTHI